jgi:hypothetical protein
VDQHWPLPTPEDRRLFMLAYAKTYSLQVGGPGSPLWHGPEHGPSVDHVLWPVLLTALRPLGDAPARSLTALAQRLGVSGPDAAAVVDGPNPTSLLPRAISLAETGLRPF